MPVALPTAKIVTLRPLPYREGFVNDEFDIAEFLNIPPAALHVMRQETVLYMLMEPVLLLEPPVPEV